MSPQVDEIPSQYPNLFYNLINDDGSQRPDSDDLELTNAYLHKLLQIENASEAIKEITYLETTCKLKYILNKVANNWMCSFPPDKSKYGTGIKSIGANVLGDPQEIENICNSEGSNCQQILQNYMISEITENLFLRESRQYITEYRSSFDYIIHMVALTLQDGAHWAAMIYESSTGFVHLYDSMQTKKPDGCSKSPYTFLFKAYAQQLFGVSEYEVRIQGCSRCPDENIRDKLFHRQISGGFFHEPDKIVDEYGDIRKLRIEEYQSRAPLKFIQIQDFKSQHHFCYMEALLFIIEFLVFKKSGFRPEMFDIDKFLEENLDVKELANERQKEFRKETLSSLLSLSYIKRFIWVLTFKINLFSETQPDDYDCVYKAYDGNFYYEPWIKTVISVEHDDIEEEDRDYGDEIIYEEKDYPFPTQNSINFFMNVFPYAWNFMNKKFIQLIDNRQINEINNIRNCKDLLEFVYDTKHLIDPNTKHVIDIPIIYK